MLRNSDGSIFVREVPTIQPLASAMDSLLSGEQTSQETIITISDFKKTFVSVSRNVLRVHQNKEQKETELEGK
jgi:hypothetical protein